MIIGTVELLRLVREAKLVENLDERELINPEGAGFDLRAGEFFTLEAGEAFLGVKDRHTPKEKSIAKYGVNKDIVIRPGDYYLVKTMEKFNFPHNIAVAELKPRSTLQRCGIDFLSAAVHPGYIGELTFGIKNTGHNDVRMELGGRFAHIKFAYCGENVSSYRGQWQGGRVSTEGKTEKQV